jgi:hypothetical protein
MSILSTNKKLISIGAEYSAGQGIDITDHIISVVESAVGTNYSAGPNIDIYDDEGQPTISSKDWTNDIEQASANAYEQAIAQIPEPQDLSYLSGRIDTNTNGIDYISSVCLTAHQDWTDTIKGASSYSYEQSTSYFDNWVEGQYTGDITNITNKITALSGDLDNYYKKTETSSKDEINDALQYVSANAGKVYEGVSPIVVNNTEDKISADTWTFSAGSNVSFVDDNVNKITRIDVELPQPQDLSYISAQTDKANQGVDYLSGVVITALPSDMATTGDVAELAQTVSETYQVKGDYATNENVFRATSGKANLSDVIEYLPKPPANAINAQYNTLRNVNEIGGSAIAINTSNLYVSGIVTGTNVGFTANGISAYSDSAWGGFTANGITAGPKATFAIQGQGESLTESYGNGFVFSSVNTGIGTARLTIASPNSFVHIYSPKFEAKNISGAGFSIEGSGARGYDENGNVIWDTSKPAKLIGWANYQGTAIDPRANGINGGIIATVYPDMIPNTMMISSAPYTYMNGYGFYACNSNGTKLSVETSNSTITLVHPVMSATAKMSPGDVSYTKYNTTLSANEIWSLTGSVQKREIEYDADTSAITAINGSAIGGGGVTGEFVPQSAFDELKQSYDALSSLFATYSGQWLLPNEGV